MGRERWGAGKSAEFRSGEVLKRKGSDLLCKHMDDAIGAPWAKEKDDDRQGEPEGREVEEKDRASFEESVAQQDPGRGDLEPTAELKEEPTVEEEFARLLRFLSEMIEKGSKSKQEHEVVEGEEREGSGGSGMDGGTA
jgi:hypothetical protein